ncbi:MAG: hypothetical protein H7318_11200 [Oligoflexus sp.]|nr:hypothetical protein [Oligoflexus sp.]
MHHVSQNRKSRFCFHRSHVSLTLALSLALTSVSAHGFAETKTAPVSTVSPTPALAPTPTSVPAEENKIFVDPNANIPKVPDNCELLSRGPGVALQDSEVTLHSFLEKVIDDLQQDKFQHLSEYFHPRAKVKSDLGEKIRSIIMNRYNAPLQYSIFRVWRVTSPSASKQILENCPESDGAKIITSFGYSKQFAVWIQIMSQNELGRLILSVAPDKGKVSIVGFRIQQWTQSGEDWRTWAGKAEAAEAKKDPKLAYLAYDISQKLLDGKDFVTYPIQPVLIQKRDEMFSQAKLIEAVNKDLGITTTAYVGTLLAKEGSGMFLREYIAKELPTSTLRDMCASHGHTLQKTGWLSQSQGLRCNYIFKGMDPLHDSGLGGFYITADDLKPNKK